MPQNYAETLWGLGVAYQDANQFYLAHNTFESAIATIESLREEIVSGEESKRKQAQQFNTVYSRMVEVCLELGRKNGEHPLLADRPQRMFEKFWANIIRYYTGKVRLRGLTQNQGF
ncbi:MAG: hypothetical protein V7L27_18490 [Nostoc sp.]|uniref:hypothetical protein n=1 Tax=Nostoc sp. TaxID=1180 RepID=UPI002FF9D2CD